MHVNIMRNIVRGSYFCNKAENGCYPPRLCTFEERGAAGNPVLAPPALGSYYGAANRVCTHLELRVSIVASSTTTLVVFIQFNFLI